MEDSKSDKVTEECNWCGSFSLKELREAQENDHDLKHLLHWKTGSGPSEIELSLSSLAVKHWWNSKELLTIVDGVLYYTWIDETSGTRLVLVPKALRETVLAGCQFQMRKSPWTAKDTAETALKIHLVWYIPRLQKICSVLQGM